MAARWSSSERQSLARRRTPGVGVIGISLFFFFLATFSPQWSNAAPAKEEVTKRSCEIPMFRPCPHTPTKTLWIYEAFRGCIEELSCSGKPVDGTFLTKEDCVKNCVTLH